MIEVNYIQISITIDNKDIEKIKGKNENKHEVEALDEFFESEGFAWTIIPRTYRNQKFIYQGHECDDEDENETTYIITFEVKPYEHNHNE